MSYAGGSGDIPGSALGTDVTDGEWHHLVAISEHEVSTRLWVDGELVATGDPIFNSVWTFCGTLACTLPLLTRPYFLTLRA